MFLLPHSENSWESSQVHSPLYFLQLFTLKKQKNKQNRTDERLIICLCLCLWQRKQDYLNPGKTYVTELACCLCCSSNLLQECRSARMTGSFPHTWALSHPPTSACPSPHSLLAIARDLGIPAVTQELPPLLSAFFSSRSELRTPTPMTRVVFYMGRTVLRPQKHISNSSFYLQYFLKQHYILWNWSTTSLKYSPATCCQLPFLNSHVGIFLWRGHLQS